MRTLLIALAAGSLVAPVSSLAGDFLLEADARTWPAEHVAPGEVLDLRLMTGADLRILTWNRDSVSVKSDWTERRCPDARIEVTRTSEGVRVESRYPPDSEVITHNCSFSVEVRVPKRFDVRIRSAGGGVAISGLNGSVTGTTGGGAIELVDLKGTVRLKTGGGAIRVSDSDLDGSLLTGGGRIKFDNVWGAVTARSGSMRGVVRGRSGSI